jgi:hypothetical protein
LTLIIATSPWSFGWDALVAIGTLALAFMTAALALSTRRLARETAEEVQGQTRPLVVPAGGEADVSERIGVAGNEYFEMTVRLRNIGAGPALNFDLRIGGPESTATALAALGAGSERDAVIRVPLIEGEGAHPFTRRTSSIHVEYYDLAGRVYTTTIPIMSAPIALGQRARLGYYITLGATSVVRQAPISSPALIENPLMAASQRRPGFRGLGFAWRYYVLPKPDDVPKPFRERVGEAWRWLYPKRRRTWLQRLAWGRRAYKATLDKPIRPWVPRGFHRLYVIARGWKWAYLVYRGMN